MHLPATGCDAMQCRTVQCNVMHFALEEPLDVNSDDSHFSVDARKMNTNQTSQPASQPVFRTFLRERKCNEIRRMNKNKGS